MRTTVVMDKSLTRQARQATGLLTKKAVVEVGLRLLIKVKGQESVRRLLGTVVFDSGTC